MGLKYASGDSANLLNTMTSNLEAASKAMESLKSGSRRLTQAVDGKTLSGAAYEAGQGLFKELIIPTITRVQRALEEIQSDVRVYRNADGNVSGEGYLDEDNLREQVRIKRGLIMVAQGNAYLCDWLALITMDAFTSQVHYRNARKYDWEVDKLQEEISKLEDKIKRLREFSYAVEGLFGDSVNELAIAIQSVKVLNQTTVHNNGTYALPFGMDKTWFKEKKDPSNKLQMQMQALRILVSLEDDAIAGLGLTKEEKDFYKGIKAVLLSNSGKKIDDFIKNSDGLWGKVDTMVKKHPKLTATLFKQLENLKKIDNSKTIKLFKTVTSPVKALFRDWLKLPEKLADTKNFKPLGKGAVLGVKFDVATTAAGIIVNGVAQGITDGIKENSVGKGVISCGIEMVKSIGPFEGAALGSSFGPLGTLAGGVVGLVNSFIQNVAPDFYDNIKEGAYKLYDDAVDKVKEIGKAVSQELKTIKNAASDFFKDVVDTIPKFPKLEFGW